MVVQRLEDFFSILHNEFLGADDVGAERRKSGVYYIYLWFNDGFSSSWYVASIDRMSKDTAVLYCKLLSGHLPGGTKESREVPQGSRSPG